MQNYFPYSFVSVQQSLQQLHHKFDHRFHHNYLIGWPDFLLIGTRDVIIIYYKEYLPGKGVLNREIWHMKYIFCRLNAVN